MSSAVDAEMAKVRAHIGGALQQVILEINKELRKNGKGTPVDTGHARANWVPSIRSPFLEEVAGTSSSAADAGIAAVLAYKLGDGTLYVSNNVPYIQALNRGHSTKAPRLFVEACVDRALATVEKKLGVDLGRARIQDEVGSAGADNLAGAYSPFGGDDD